MARWGDGKMKDKEMRGSADQVGEHQVIRCRVSEYRGPRIQEIGATTDLNSKTISVR